MTVEYLVFLVISVGLSLLAGYLLQPKDKALAKDDKPSTTATRGTFIPWVLGIRRVGAIVSWVGNRVVRSEDAPGGKGSITETPEVDVYYENAVHDIASNGPVHGLRTIQQQGKVIFQGPITRDSHPSGSTIDLGKEGSFTIYWGEEGTDQPVDVELGGRIGVTSRWSFHCRVHWKNKRLGPSPNWPLLDYTIDVRCEFSDSILSSTSSYMPATLTLDGPSLPILDGHNGSEGAGYFEVLLTNDASFFGPDDTIRLNGNAMANQDLVILKVEHIQIPLGGFPPQFEVHARIYPYGGVSGSNDSGTLQLYSSADNDGLNPAHCIAEMLFAPWPRGLARNPADFNIDGGGNDLETLGLLCETEDLRASLIAQNGETAKSILGGLLQDVGVMVPVNTLSGKIDFVPIRDVDPVTLPEIPLDAQTESLPEVETQQGERSVDKLIFSFADRANFFRDMTIALAADGQAAFEEHQRARKVDITSTVIFDVAQTIAERRSQEELAGGTVYRWKSNRGVRELLPGQAVLLEGIDEVLRLTAVGIDPELADVELQAISDFMGAKAANYGGTVVPPFPASSPQPDLAFGLVEVPAYLLTNGDPVTLIVPHIRDNAGVRGSTVWISADDVTYYSQGTDTRFAAGGTLDSPLGTDSDSRVLAQGPTITILGPDIGTVLDLSADDTSWRLGRQLCVISSSAGVEVCYLKAVTAIDADTYRLDGLIRARYDTEQLAHPAGAEVYIVQNDLSFGVQDVLIVPGATIYVKTTPTGIPLSMVAPRAFVIRGKNLTPMDPLNLHAHGPGKFAHVYSAGEAIECAWGYRSSIAPVSGAGLGGAGNPYTAPPVQGSFILEFLTSVDVLKKQVAITSPTYTLTNADLVSAFGSEPATFKVRVRGASAGYESSNVEITVKKV